MAIGVPPDPNSLPTGPSRRPKVVGFLKTAIAIGAAATSIMNPSFAEAKKTPSAEARANTKTAKQYFEEGQEAYEAKHYVAAATLFEEAIKLEPRPQFTYNIAMCWRHIGEEENSLAAFNKAKGYLGDYLMLLMDPSTPEAARARGEIAEIDHLIEKLQKAHVPPVATTPAPIQAAPVEATAVAAPATPEKPKPTAAPGSLQKHFNAALTYSALFNTQDGKIQQAAGVEASVSLSKPGSRKAGEVGVAYAERFDSLEARGNVHTDLIVDSNVRGRELTAFGGLNLTLGETSGVEFKLRLLAALGWAQHTETETLNGVIPAEDGFTANGYVGAEATGKLKNGLRLGGQVGAILQVDHMFPQAGPAITSLNAGGGVGFVASY